MSAATMISCASNRIVMARHSFIGPIDPQFILQTKLGVMAVPAQAILDQFEMGREDCKNPDNMGAWMPILDQYGPALLIQSQDAIDLSQKYVSDWLARFMFHGKKDANTIAAAIAEKLADHTTFKSHGHHIDRNEARAIGLVIEDLENDQTLQDLVLSIFHATTHTFNGSAAVKIIENQNGRAYIRLQGGPVQGPPQHPP